MKYIKGEIDLSKTPSGFMETSGSEETDKTPETLKESKVNKMIEVYLKLLEQDYGEGEYLVDVEYMLKAIRNELLR